MNRCSVAVNIKKCYNKVTGKYLLYGRNGMPVRDPEDSAGSFGIALSENGFGKGRGRRMSWLAAGIKEERERER